MKHLRKFESNSDRNKEVVEYLKDIFQELEDDNYNIKVENLMVRYPTWDRGFVSNSYHANIQIDISKQCYKLEDIYDYILTAKSYMKDNNFYLYDFEVVTRSADRYNLMYSITLYEKGVSQLISQDINYAKIIFNIEK